MSIALFPGSFDPVTNGHIDIIQRALKIFDKVIVVVAINDCKKSMFTVEERLSLLEKAANANNLKNIIFRSFDGLLVEAVNKYQANVVIRGLRAISDFEFEIQMAMMNRELNNKCETIFLMPRPEYSFVSSRMIKEIAKFGGDISGFVPSCVVEILKKRRN